MGVSLLFACLLLCAGLSFACTCSPGQGCAADGVTCQACPAGTFSSDSSGVCQNCTVSCGPGTGLFYQGVTVSPANNCILGGGTQDNTCSACPAGSFGNTKTSTCISCSAPQFQTGTYQYSTCTASTDDIYTSCTTTCPIGQQLLFNGGVVSDTNACGLVDGTVDNNCQPCPANTFSASVTGVCSACNFAFQAGTYESTACTFSTDVVYSNCTTTCLPGQQLVFSGTAVSGTNACGLADGTSDNTCTACPASTFAAGTNGVCTACSTTGFTAGTYQVTACTATTDQVYASCTSSCAVGQQFLFGGAAVSMTNGCGISDGTVDNTCSACPFGTFSTDTSGVCNTCAPANFVSGTYQSTQCTASTDRVYSACTTACAPGEQLVSFGCGFSDGFMNNLCQSCPAGTFSSNTNGICFACSQTTFPFGTFRTSSCTSTTDLVYTVCTSSCSVGQQLFYNGSVVTGSNQCGLVEDVIDNTCAPCPDGTFSTTTSGHCAPCAVISGFTAGTYQASVCTAVTNNLVLPCTASCSVGQQLAFNGSVLSSSNQCGLVQGDIDNNCEPCPNGFFSSGTSGVCSPCTVHTFQPGTFISAACSATSDEAILGCTTTCATGNQLVFNGIAVNASYGCGVVEGNVDNVCSSCPPGTFSADTTGVCHACTLSKPGFILEFPCASNADSVFFSCFSLCESCSVAFSQFNCTTCVAGYILENGLCMQCPTGTYAASGSASCDQCVAGTVDSDFNPATPCVPCDGITQYQNLAGQTQCRTVTSCMPDVMFLLTPSNSTNDALCQPCTVNCAVGEELSIMCNATSDGVCSPCSSGHFKDVVGPKLCSPCTASCDASSFSTAACNATADLACSRCTTTCTPGQGLSFQGSPLTLLNNCLNNFGAVDNVCLPCPADSFSTDSLGTCHNCSIVGFSTGHFMSSACSSVSDLTYTSCTTTCPIGQQLLFNGSVVSDTNACGLVDGTVDNNCQPCPANTFSAGVTGVCSACNFAFQAGTYESTACTFSTDVVYSNCTTTCLPGQQLVFSGTAVSGTNACGLADGTSDNTCTACPAGTFSTGTNGVCTACSTTGFTAGTYQVTACTSTTDQVYANCTSSCAVGQQLVFGGAAVSMTNGCGISDGTVDNTCSACPAGTFSTDTSGVCNTCSSNFVAGSFEIIACTASTDRVYSACTSSCTPGQGLTYLGAALSMVNGCGLADGNVDNVCSECAPGTFNNDTSGVCTTCSTQAFVAGNWQFSACTNTTDLVFKSCTTSCAVGQELIYNGTVTSPSNLCGLVQADIDNTCQACSAGTFSSNGLECVNCSSNTFVLGLFRVSSCSASTDIAYSTCTTSCQPGQQLVFNDTAVSGTNACGLADGTSDNTCTACPASTFAAGTNGVCTACSTTGFTAGTYQVTACTATTDQVYANCTSSCAVGQQLVFGGAAVSMTNGCGLSDGTVDNTCSACPFGTFSTDTSGVCNTCSSGFTAGTYQSTQCTASTDRVYSNCTLACTPGQGLSFMGAALSMLNECGLADGIVDNICSTCAVGSFNNDTTGICTACSTVCAAGEEVVTACTSTTDAVCGACQPGFVKPQSGAQSCSACSQCVTGSTFQVTACTTTVDTQCGACSTSCPAGQYSVMACTAMSNAVCGRCTSITDCQANSRLVGSCSFSSNPVCTACTTTCATGKHPIGTCDSLSDYTCVPCTAPTSCPSNQTITGSCGINTVPTCQLCAACGANQYLPSNSVCSTHQPLNCTACTTQCSFGFYLAGTCQNNHDFTCSPCKICGAGTYRSSGCSSSQDAVCSNCTTSCPQGLVLTGVCGPESNTVCKTPDVNDIPPIDTSYSTGTMSWFPTVTLFNPATFTQGVQQLLSTATSRRSVVFTVVVLSYTNTQVVFRIEASSQAEASSLSTLLQSGVDNGNLNTILTSINSTAFPSQVTAFVSSPLHVTVSAIAPSNIQIGFDSTTNITTVTWDPSNDLSSDYIVHGYIIYYGAPNSLLTVATTTSTTFQPPAFTPVSYIYQIATQYVNGSSIIVSPLASSVYLVPQASKSGYDATYAASLAGSAAAVFVLIIILIITVHHWRRQDYLLKKEQLSNREISERLDDIRSQAIAWREKTQTPPTKRKQPNPRIIMLLNKSRPMDMDKLEAYLSNDNQIIADYKSMPLNVIPQEDLIIGTENKNRYKNILPSPHSRVRLKQIGEDSLTKYINANYVEGYGGHSRAYIAAQGPLDTTVIDFWRMIWEQRCSVIIMAARFTEEGKSKCAKYFPENNRAMRSGSLVIKCVENRLRSGYIVSIFHVKLHKSDRKPRIIKHYWANSWPDHGVPHTTAMLINLLNEVYEDRLANPKAPVLVHCSAGCGRTGAIIGVDIGMQQIEHELMIDPLKILGKVRLGRGGSIQTEDQYHFMLQAFYDFLADVKRFQAYKHRMSKTSLHTNEAMTQELQELIEQEDEQHIVRKAQEFDTQPSTAIPSRGSLVEFDSLFDKPVDTSAAPLSSVEAQERRKQEIKKELAEYNRRHSVRQDATLFDPEQQQQQQRKSSFRNSWHVDAQVIAEVDPNAAAKNFGVQLRRQSSLLATETRESVDEEEMMGYKYVKKNLNKTAGEEL